MTRELHGHRARDSRALEIPDGTAPEIVEAHLRADKNLTPETAAALSELFRVAYTQFSRNAGDKAAKKRR